TGVQTCALPISDRPGRSGDHRRDGEHERRVLPGVRRLDRLLRDGGLRRAGVQLRRARRRVPAGRRHRERRALRRRRQLNRRPLPIDHRPPTTDHRPPTNLNITTTNRRDPMKTRHALTTALAAGAALTLAGCGGGSYDDSRDLYEELRVEIGCDTVDSDDFDSYMEGEVADGFPAFDTVEGECQAGDD